MIIKNIKIPYTRHPMLITLLILMIALNQVSFATTTQSETSGMTIKHVLKKNNVTYDIQNEAVLNEPDALMLIDELLSPDTKLLRQKHDAANPSMPLIKNIKLSNSYDVSDSSIAVFKGGLSKSSASEESILNFDSGVALSTGTTKVLESHSNTSHQISFGHLTGNKLRDAQLESLVDTSSYSTFDTAYIQFDLYCPASVDNEFLIDYALASDEYNEYLTYNDIFGFFINGKNIAVIPGSNKPVSVSNINHLTFSQFFRNNKKDSSEMADNYGSDDHFLDLPTEYDGLTTTLTAKGVLNKGKYNTVKLAIADFRDPALDSTVFIKSSSIRLQKVQYGEINLDSWNEITPYTHDIEVVRYDGSDNAVSVDFEVYDQNNEKLMLIDALGKNTNQFTVRFDAGQTQKKIRLPQISKDAMILGKLPTRVHIFNPLMGATIGRDTLTKGYSTPTVKFQSTEITTGTLNVVRQGNMNFSSTLNLVLTRQNGTTEIRKISFAPAESTYPLVVTNDMVNLALKDPRGARLGIPSEISRNIQSKTMFGKWNNTSPKTDDTIEILKTTDLKSLSSIIAVITDIMGVAETRLVKFDVDESLKLLTIPEKTKTIELKDPQNTIIIPPTKLEKFFPNIPTKSKRIIFDVYEDSEVTLFLKANFENPRLNYKITKLKTASTSRTFNFYGDGRNLKNGMKEVYFMEPGTYMVNIYWLDKRQAETIQEIENDISKTEFTYTIKSLKGKIDKKKFYRKIN